MINSDPKTGAHMEEDDFDKYEIDEEFKRMFWRQSGEGTKTVNGLSDDQELRLWLKSLLEDEDYERHKDVEFIVGGKGQERSVRAHRLILTTRSRTFADMLDKELDQHQPIKIADTDPTVFETIVHYVYTGQIEAPSRVLGTVDLMHAADEYDIAPLHTLIKHFLERRLPKLRIKHFIMITQRVLDLNLTQLETFCFTLVEGRTDQVVQDPMFLRVSSTFIARLLELDNFSGITEAAVFARVLEWATLRSGGSILAAPPPTSDAREHYSHYGHAVEEGGFRLARPDVRGVLELFIRSFRLTSVPKDDLAALVKNSGVFTEHEQLVVSYYLLDQTKNLEDFSMKQRGSKIGTKRASEHARAAGDQSPKKPPPSRPLIAPVAPPTPTPPPPPPPPPQPQVRIRDLNPEILHNNHKAEYPPGNIVDSPVMTEVFRIHGQPEDKPDELVAIFKVASRPESKLQQTEHVPNPDFGIQQITTKSKDTPPPSTTPKLMEKLKHRFSSDKTKSEEKDGKPKKDKKLKKTPSGRVIQTASIKSTSGTNTSSSPSSAGSSRTNSPTALSRRSMNVDGDSNHRDDTAFLRDIQKNQPNDAKRPKSMYEGDLSPDQGRKSESKDSGSGSVGKKGGIRSRLAGFMTPTSKKGVYSPDQGRTNGKDGKPAPPPRVKSTSDLSVKPAKRNSNIEAEI